MLQGNLFNQEIESQHSLCEWSNKFKGQSLFVNDRYTRQEPWTYKRKGQVVSEHRVIERNVSVDAYRNLNRPELFSARLRAGPHSGKVACHARSVILTGFKFVVGEVSRQSVLRNTRRVVHAYVRGEIVDLIDGHLDVSKVPDAIRCTYSPYLGPKFHVRGTETEADPSLRQYAVLNGADVFLTNF